MIDRFSRPAGAVLSSGQLQRLALASVLATNPDVLIADEPTTMLDARYAKLVSNQLFASADRQLVLITHDLELARAATTSYGCTTPK